MARSYVMTPRRRTALRKAQLASARKRRGKGLQIHTAAAVANGRNRQLKRRKNLKRAAVVVAGGAAVGTAAYQIHYHRNYVTGYHRTSYDNANRIVKTQQWASKTHKRANGQGVEGSATGIWFSKHRFGPGPYKPWGATNKNFGPGVVKVKRIPKKLAVKHSAVMHDYILQKGGTKAQARFYGATAQRDWFMVDTKHLAGLKAKRSPNPTTKLYRKFKRKQLSHTTMTAPHMSYLINNWADPKPRQRTRARKRRR